jgi:transposase
MSTKRTRQNYTKEFIQDAVQLVTEQGYGCNEVARRLGINRSNITRWVREYRQNKENLANGPENPAELKAEIRRLKKEKQRLQMEREILKKAAAFFAKESV